MNCWSVGRWPAGPGGWFLGSRFVQMFSFLVGGFLGEGISEALSFFLVVGQSLSRCVCWGRSP